MLGDVSGVLEAHHADENGVQRLRPTLISTKLTEPICGASGTMRFEIQPYA